MPSSSTINFPPLPLLLPPLPMMFSNPITLLNEFWQKNVDPELMEAFFIFSTPLYYFMSLISLIIFIKVVGPIIVKVIPSLTRKDYRPIMLIMNGFFFGVNGAGVPMAYFTTYYGWNFFLCDATPTQRDIGTWSLKQMCIVYLVLIQLDLMKPCLSALRDRMRSSNLELLNSLIFCSLQFMSLSFYPAGFTIFTGACIMTHRIFHYGYLVMTVTSKEMKPSPNNLILAKLIVRFVEIAVNLIICIHNLYFGFRPYPCGNKTLLLLVGSYSGLNALFLLVGVKNLVRLKKRTFLIPSSYETSINQEAPISKKMG